VFLKRELILVILLSLSTTSFSQKPRADVTGTHLLKTAWGGSSPLNMFAPNASTLGCHSNAFAQIMYYHKLSPHGRISYKCTSGTMISEDFSGYAPRWNRFALDKEAGKKDISATKETARFIYNVAAVVRKDFGTDQYVAYPNDYHKKSIESHFHCTLTAYANKVRSTIARALKDQPDFYALLKAEIDSCRPAGFYYLYEGGGHAVVIDGYVSKDGKTFFHVNFGWLGRSDGWYLLEEDLPPNTKEIALILIAPKDQSKLEEEKS